MYHRNVIPAFVIFSIATLLVIILGSFYFQTETTPTFQITTSSSSGPIIPPNSPFPQSSDPLVTPGPSLR